MADSPQGMGQAPSYFHVLGLPERFNVDASELEASFHRMSRLLHPDRFNNATGLERRLAVQRTTLLNDAYRTLLDPLRRAEYLLRREGAHPGERAQTQDPELLMEIMEGRERVAELKERLDAEPGAALAELEALRAQYGEKLQADRDTLRSQFERYDAGARDEAVSALVRVILEIRYYLGIKAELDHLALKAGQLA